MKRIERSRIGFGLRGAPPQRVLGAAVLLGLLLPAAALAAEVTLEDLTCLPSRDNGVLYARVATEKPWVEVRLYFRRFHHLVEDFYWVEMEHARGGRFWGVFPRPEEHRPRREELDGRRRKEADDIGWARWWKAKEASDHRNPNGDLDDDRIRERATAGKRQPRDWMAALDEGRLQSWLAEKRDEPAEYYVVVLDDAGTPLTRSPMRAVAVTKDCRPSLSEQQRGRGENLTVGETASWQRGEKVFHWQCDGIVTRIDPQGVPRADDVCRACVIPWWRKQAFLAPGAAIGSVGITDIIDPKPPEEVSPSRP